MLTLMDRMDRIRTVVSSAPREMCVRALNGTVARWLLCVKQDGEQVETCLVCFVNKWFLQFKG
jgi:hypothetical protein